MFLKTMRDAVSLMQASASSGTEVSGVRSSKMCCDISTVRYTRAGGHTNVRKQHPGLKEVVYCTDKQANTCCSLFIVDVVHGWV